MGLCVQTSANVKTSHVTHSLGDGRMEEGRKKDGVERTDGKMGAIRAALLLVLGSAIG